LNSSRHQRYSRGFTLLEILLVIAIIGILGAVALVSYQSYVGRARAAELALKFDAIRSNLSTATKAGVVAEQCQQVAASVQPGNLVTPYVAMDVSFEAVTGGFAPVLRMCATSDVHGTSGISVAREAHHLLSRNVKVGAGAVIGDSLVSFALPLTDGVAACKAPATAAAKPLCAGAPTGTAPVTAQLPGPVAQPPATPAQPPAPVPKVGSVTLMPKITGATALSEYAGVRTGVPVGTQLVGLYLAGSDVNQLGGANPAQLPRVSTGYTPVGDSGYQYLDSQGVLARLMPTMLAKLTASAAVGQGNPWDGGIAVFADGTVARMHKVSNGDPSGSEKDYVYFNVLSGVNAQQGMSIVSGTGVPGQSVQVRNGNTVLATVRADAQGNWNFAGAASLAGPGQSITVTPAPANP